MMGERAVMQEALFYGFSLEDHVPQDHLLRSIDRFVDLGGIREHLRPYYSEMGRPSIDPELMIRMLIIGYCMGIRSERRLCEEVHLNLAYRWFCRIGLDGAVPDHSTFSKNRHGRFRDSDLLRELFETTVARCMEEGLVGGNGFATDASLIKADANKQRSAEGWREVDWEGMAATRRSVREYLDTLDDAAWGAATEVQPKFVSKSDPAAQWRRSPQGPCLLRLCHELPDRPRSCRHRRRRSEPRYQAGRGRGDAHHDRPGQGPVRPLPPAAGCRQCLRVRRDA
jgi:transposase